MKTIKILKGRVLIKMTGDNEYINELYKDNPLLEIEDRLREEEINRELHYSNLAEKEKDIKIKNNESLIIYFRKILNDKSKSKIEKDNARNKLKELLEEKEK